MLRSSRSSLFVKIASLALVSGAIGTAAVAKPARLAVAKPASVQSQTVTVTPADYRTFRDQISQISKLRLDDPKNVDRAKIMLLAHDERELSHGWVAQCSDVAAHEDKFVAGVKRAAERAGGPEQLIAQLKSQPSSVLEISGWQSASQAILSAVAQDGAAMQSVSHRLSEIAYGRTAKEAQLASEAQRSSGVTGATKARSPRTASPMMTQILALGAVMTVSQETRLQVTPVEASLVVDKDNDQCLRWSDLNLKQCLAAARDNQERAYCLSEEAIGSRSDCWSKVVQPAS